MRTRKLTLKLEVYSSVINIYLCESLIKCIDTIRKKYPLLEPHEAEDALGLSFSDYENYPGEYWIVLTKEAGIRELAHEAAHTTNRLLFEHSVVFDVENDEPYAYLVGYITSVLYSFINKPKKK